MQVGRDDHVQGPGLEHHARGHGIDQLLVGRHVRELARDLGEGLVPEHHAVALGVRLGDQGEPLLRARARELEGKAYDPGAAGAGEHGKLGPDLLGQAAMHPPAGAGVLAFGVLAHHDPIQVARLDGAERARHPGQEARRADVGVLIEALTDREAQAPERDVVGDVRRADRAEIDGIETAQLLEAVRGHHPAVPAVVGGAPVERCDLETQLGLARAQGVQHLEPGGDDLLADAVPGDRRDAMESHLELPPWSATRRSVIGASRGDEKT